MSNALTVGHCRVKMIPNAKGLALAPNMGGVKATMGALNMMVHAMRMEQLAATPTMTVSEIANVSGQPAIRLASAKLILIYAARSMTCAVLKEPQMNAKEMDMIRAEAGMVNVEMRTLVPFLI